jgi:hypothetical protein
MNLQTTQLKFYHNFIQKIHYSPSIASLWHHLFHAMASKASTAQSFSISLFCGATSKTEDTQTRFKWLKTVLMVLQTTACRVFGWQGQASEPSVVQLHLLQQAGK